MKTIRVIRKIQSNKLIASADKKIKRWINISITTFETKFTQTFENQKQWYTCMIWQLLLNLKKIITWNFYLLAWLMNRYRTALFGISSGHQKKYINHIFAKKNINTIFIKSITYRYRIRQVNLFIFQCSCSDIIS